MTVVCAARYDSGKVDMSDLTWEQKERVLRYLFARMNGGSAKEKRQTSSAPTLPAIEQGQRQSLMASKDDTWLVLSLKKLHVFHWWPTCLVII